MSSIEGLWSIDFETPLAGGGGVIVFETLRVFGGDAGRTFIGHYECKNNELVGQVRVSSFLTKPEASVFNDTNDFDLNVIGSLPVTFQIGAKFQLVGTRADSKLPLLINFIKRAELPNAY